MTFKNDLELFEALLAGEIVVRTDEFNYIEFKLVDGFVNKSYDSGKTWDNSPIDVHSSFLTIKQKTIKIGEFDVPEPVREPLSYGTKYFVPCVFSKCLTTEYPWGYSSYDDHYLNSGWIHLTQESAQKHAVAIIALSAL